MKSIDPNKINNILVFQTAFLGDVVLTTPIFKNIKAHFKNAKVTALVIPGNAPVISGNPYVDSVITYDKKGGKGAKSFLDTLSEVKCQNFDLVFSLHRSFRTSLMLYLSRIPVRIGFSDSAGSFFYTDTVKRDMTAHDVKRNLSILNGAGIKEDDISDELLVTYSDADKKSLEEKMGARESLTEKHESAIVVSPGSVWATKRYPHESYAEVIKMLKADGRFDIVLSGGKDDIAIADEIVKLAGGGIINLTGKTTLKELAALLDSAALMITNDSGPLHIAASFNTPIVAIFGATTTNLGFAPYNKNSVVVEKELDCRPCGKHGGMKCPITTFDCMKLIQPEEAYEAATKLISGSTAK